MLTRHNSYTTYNNTIIAKFQCKLQFKLQLFVQSQQLQCFPNCNLPWFNSGLFLYRNTLLLIKYGGGTPTRCAGMAIQLNVITDSKSLLYFVVFNYCVS